MSARSSTAAGTPRPTSASCAPTRIAPPTAATPRSPTPTATPGCSRRSPSASPAGSDRVDTARRPPRPPSRRSVVVAGLQDDDVLVGDQVDEAVLVGGAA